MTIEAQPTTVKQEDISTKKQIQEADGMDAASKSEVDTAAIVEKEVEEPTLNIQIENPDDIKTGEELMPTSATEDKPKRKSLFNNPFLKGGSFKKEFSDEVTTATENAGSESKITKGFGNFLSKVKQTTSNNIKELSEPAPTTTAVLVEGDTVEEEKQAGITTDTVIENITVTQANLPTAEQSSNSNKRQSVLNKLFGAKDQTEVENKEQQTEGEEPTASSSSPPLSRRVTEFFAKKIPKLDKKQKSNDKVEVSAAKEEIANSEEASTAEEITSEEGPAKEEFGANKEGEEPSVIKVTETAPVVNGEVATDKND